MRDSRTQIAATLKLFKGVVAEYVALASTDGLDWDAVRDWSKLQLAAALQPRSVSALSFVFPTGRASTAGSTARAPR